MASAHRLAFLEREQKKAEEKAKREQEELERKAAARALVLKLKEKADRIAAEDGFRAGLNFSRRAE